MANFTTDIFAQFDKKWALLCAGTKEKHNTMTISWGGMGTFWSKPVVTVYVKPCRYTYGFMNDNEYFTVSFYPEECRKAMAVMGTKSGRDINKDEVAGLTVKPIGQVVTYEEAEVTIICRKMLWSGFTQRKNRIACLSVKWWTLLLKISHKQKAFKVGDLN